jgi:N utilization substance protein B
MTRKRSRAREVALQLLFQHDLNPGVPRQDLERFVRQRLAHTPRATLLEATRRDEQLGPERLGEELKALTWRLYDGVLEHAADIDGRLSRAAENWRVQRMASADRNVLRLGTFELLHLCDTPPAVVINEAIELARRYGAAGSGAFVNGVLDRLHKDRNQESGVRSQEQAARSEEGALRSEDSASRLHDRPLDP